MAGAATGLLVAILALKDPVKNFIAAMIEGSNAIPKSTDALDALNTELKTASTRLDDLKGRQVLTNSELAEYNSLLTSTAKLEKEVNEERARRNALEAARKSEQQDPAAAKAAQDAIKAGGGIDKLVEQLAPEFTSAARPEAEAGVRALREKLAKALNANRNSEADQAAVESVYRPQIEAAQKAAAAEAQRMGSGRAADLLLKARQGDAGAIAELANRLPAAGFNAATPAGLASARETEAARKRSEEDAKQQADDLARRQEAADMREADAFIANTERTPEQKARRAAQVRGEREAAQEQERADQEQQRAEARVGRPAPGRGAAIDAVKAMKADFDAQQRALLAEILAALHEQGQQIQGHANFIARARQNVQTSRTRMGRVPPGFEAQPDGGNDWAPINPMPPIQFNNDLLQWGPG